jgi:hypothetical protein
LFSSFRSVHKNRPNSGGQRPFEREGGPVCYEAMPSASFHLVEVWLRPDCLGWGNFERRMIVCIRKEKPA